VVDALRGFEQRWTSGRRVLNPAGVIALIAAAATSALVASTAEPRATDIAATRPTPPSYLLAVGALVRDGSLPPPALTGDRSGVGVPPGTPKAPTVPNVAQAAQGPTISPYQGTAGTLTPAGIATLALEHGCAPDAAGTATAIAMAESGGSPSAQGDIGLMTSDWDWSAGLWQIRGLRAERNTGGLRDSVANQAVDHNAAAMHTISRGCTDWTPWSTFNTGAYLQYGTLAQQAARYVMAYYNAHGHHYPPVAAPDPNAAIPSQNAGGGPAPQAGAAGTRTSNPARHRPTTPKPARSTGGGADPPATTSPAPAPASPTRSSRPKQGVLPIPVPTKALPTRSSSLPVPLPSTTLPLPLPSLPQLP
jgi:hypothetical protein